ncbi:hypothetical protein [Neorhizobium galegae]|uniref:hypothetical protein n=1 Tax=Neorhizobium galegae TaxID=399 RepID=UPI0012786AE4|nr:hypothetical protein [Neorhizobium galegae]KAA9383255.1 hypothetical protein F4V88_23245 [Neorhizobium galegae]KAB1112992.1 hypothetical protein F4V89_14595 [Neorhizobium galegae]MCM2499875.1 hypothetical protein [Neorhizobium galegae]MCQ1771753.1 hypothetical protein [Neorhizobium galegae]MCQ1776543.1 hypothetical protein [Neorhizobium galegae]
MSSRLPPTPPQNLSHKGSGEQTHAADIKRGKPQAANDPGKQGQQGNTKVNTTHQGYQQDR